MNSTTLFLGLATVAVVLFFFIEFWIKAQKRLNRHYERIAREWSRVHGLVNRDPKHAVVEADKLLEYALLKGSKNISLGEVLKKRGDAVFSEINDVWRAHKLRNRIVHEIGFEITEKDARDALRIFYRALGEAGVRFPSNTRAV